VEPVLQPPNTYYIASPTLITILPQRSPWNSWKGLFVFEETAKYREVAIAVTELRNIKQG
jgi:hypothetical protein